MEKSNDAILSSIVKALIKKHRCHTVILYGSRARGLTTATSDFDVIGIRSSGKKFRIAKKQKGSFWDVFVYPESDLKVLGEERFAWRNARIVYQKASYGTELLKRLDKLLNKPFKRYPKYEINVLKVWAQKQLDRCRIDDIQGFFRRAEFLAALVDHYFYIRQKRFLGPKEGFAWIEANDKKTYELIKLALQYSTNLSHLKAAAIKVYRVTLK